MITASLLENFKMYMSSFDFSVHPLAILDIAIVAILFYGVYVLIKGTKATRIALGLILVSAVFLAGKILNLIALTWLMKYFVMIIIVAIPVVFQPELRRALEKLGRARVVRRTVDLSKLQVNLLVETLSLVAVTLSKNRIGALIIIKRSTGLKDYIETGSVLNANLSEKLLLSIFFPNTPLHDKAVIVSGNQILAAGVTLPLSDEEGAFKYGTRHKAAIGITEITDAVALVVSEEKGTVALAEDGKLKFVKNKKDLTEQLQSLLKE